MPRSRPVRAACFRRCAKPSIIGHVQRAREDFGKIAAVVGRPDRRLVGHGRDGDEIAPADLGAIDRKLGCGAIGEAFEHVAGFGPAGAAISVGRQRIGEHAGHLHENRGRPIDAGKQRAVDRARDGGAEGRDIGAEIGQRLDPQREEMAIAVERKLSARQVIAALIVGDEAFAAVAIHLTGRRRRRAAQATIVSSG